MAASTVQHVAKPSSDQLLRKFADMEPDKPRRRKKARPVRDEPHNSSIAVPERRSLLPVANPKTGTLRQFKAKKPDLRYSMRNRFLLGLVKKRICSSGNLNIQNTGFDEQTCISEIETWNHTMERATKMLLEKHCNRHVRLRNEAV